MKKLLFAIAMLVLALLLSAFAADKDVSYLLILATMFGIGSIIFAMQFGEKLGEGHIISEEDLPSKIYKIEGMTTYGGYAVAILNDEKGQAWACRSTLLDGVFQYFIISGSCFSPRSPRCFDDAGIK